jgi:hypothetical protein
MEQEKMPGIIFHVRETDLPLSALNVEHTKKATNMPLFFILQ